MWLEVYIWKSGALSWYSKPWEWMRPLKVCRKNKKRFWKIVTFKYWIEQEETVNDASKKPKISSKRIGISVITKQGQLFEIEQSDQHHWPLLRELIRSGYKAYYTGFINMGFTCTLIKAKSVEDTGWSILGLSDEWMGREEAQENKGWNARELFQDSDVLTCLVSVYVYCLASGDRTRWGRVRLDRWNLTA